MWSSEAGAAMQPTTPIQFRWLGAAGIELVFPDQVIVIDPYFSRIPTWKLWLGRVTPDRALIADKLRRCDLLLVTHAHFDHIMDVPQIVHNTGAMVAGSANSCSLLEAFGHSRRPDFYRRGSDRRAQGQTSQDPWILAWVLA
jgi:glyoxylase-like metal-dependent hydrolase (beta-lactamase superfamily II)